MLGKPIGVRRDSAGSQCDSVSVGLPEGATWGQIAGVATLAGIGFTVSLFITGLAFDDVAIQDDAKIGILVASIVAAAAGALVFTIASRSRAAEVATSTRS